MIMIGQKTFEVTFKGIDGITKTVKSNAMSKKHLQQALKLNTNITKVIKITCL